MAYGRRARRGGAGVLRHRPGGRHPRPSASSRSGYEWPLGPRRARHGAARRDRGARRACDAPSHRAPADPRGRAPPQPPPPSPQLIRPDLPAPTWCCASRRVDTSGLARSRPPRLDGSLYLGIPCDPSPLSPQGRGQGEEPKGEGPKSEEPSKDATPSDTCPPRSPISPHLAHVYTECARIWNPYPHRPRGRARRLAARQSSCTATATLALAISQTLRHDPPRPPPRRCARWAVASGAWCLSPSRLVVRGLRPEPSPEGSNDPLRGARRGRTPRGAGRARSC